MAFKIERNDITKVHADALVNTANHYPRIGSGTDTAVYNAAGWEELLEARKKIGIIERGHSVATESFRLRERGIKYIIHTVGFHYRPERPETVQNLRNCYASSLRLAKELECKSVAIPLLATGNYGFPKELGLKIAVEEIDAFMLSNEMDVTLVVYDKQAYLISEKLFNDVQDFLDKNYEVPKKETKAEKEIEPIKVYAFISQSSGVRNFQDTLQKLIADRNLENATVYKRAYIDKKFFSKIICQKDYVPKKQTVMALGLALELPLGEYEAFLASAGYAFMPSSKFDMIIKYCVMNRIYNLIDVDYILVSLKMDCFAPE